MGRSNPMRTRTGEEATRVSVIVRDDRGFTHYYEDVVTTPEAVRDAFYLMGRRTHSKKRLAADITSLRPVGDLNGTAGEL